MTAEYSQSDLEAYLDEALPSGEMARIEKRLRKDSELIRQLASIHAHRSAGVHSLGDVWRREHLSCPGREQLGSFLLGVLPDEVAEYIAFHLEVVGCRFCQANLIDLKNQQVEQDDATLARRRRYFQTSAGYLGHKK